MNGPEFFLSLSAMGMFTWLVHSFLRTVGRYLEGRQSGGAKELAGLRAEVEALASQTRQALQQAIDAARSALDGEGRGLASTALREVAYQVQEAALAVINQRPPLVRKLSPVSGPPRLVAHALHGEPARAVEIIRINRLGRRVFVERGDALNVYAA